jgi:REP element-mobilizing transposase RayT
MKQLKLIKPTKKEHGGMHSFGRRRSRRPLTTKEPLHVTLRSDFARGSRSLLRHRPLIYYVIKKASKRFDIRVYQKAICGNHIHLLIRGRSRTDIQNFFRVVAGHIAQGILREFPLLRAEQECGLRGGGGAQCALKNEPEKSEKHKGCAKNQRKFWALLIYSRVVTWGREYKAVTNYIQKNILEALNLIAYAPRKKRGGAIRLQAGGALSNSPAGNTKSDISVPKIKNTS